MREIKAWVHDGSLYMWPHYLWDVDVEKYIADWRESVFQQAKEKNADHFIYATKTYDEDGNLIEIDLYAEALDDDEFYKRTDAEYKSKREKNQFVSFEVFHKGTAYGVKGERP